MTKKWKVRKSTVTVERILNLSSGSESPSGLTAAILELDEEKLQEANCDIRWCDEVEWQRLEVTTETEERPEYRYGHEGQLVERTKSRKVRILESKRMTLRKRAGQLVWTDGPDTPATRLEHERYG